MTMPYVSSRSPGPVGTYQIKTVRGQGVRVLIPTALDLSNYTFVMEASRSSTFRDAWELGNVAFESEHVVVEMSAAEVDDVRDGYFRIRAVRADGGVHPLVEGSISYQYYESPDDSGILDASGNVREYLLAPLVDAMDDVFLRKSDYVAGVVDPEILNAAVDGKLAVHIQSPTPHPAYDTDMQDLAILFENRLL